MEKLEKSIKNSFFYKFILYIINEAKKSFFFSCKFNPEPHSYVPAYESSFTKKVLNKIGKFIDVLSNPLSKLWKDSFFVNILDKLKKFLGQSYVGSVIIKFRFVYLLILYPVVDYAFRYLILGGRLGGIWDEAFFLLLTMLIIKRRLTENKKWKMTDMDFPLVFFITVCIVLFLMRSPDPIVAIDGFRVVVQYMLWYFLAVQLLDDDEDIKRMIYMALVMVFFVGLHACYQYVTKAPMLGNWVDSTEAITTRAYSIMFSPNLLGSFFTLFIPLIFAVFIVEKSVINKFLALMTLGISGLGLIFTLSRGAWLAAFISLLIFLLFTYKKILLPIIVFVASIVVSVPALSDRFFRLFSSDYLDKSSQGGRIFRFQLGMERWESDPIFGLGLGRFGGAVAMNYNLAPFYMDNFYMKTLVEMGVIGLSATIILYFSLITFCVLKIRGIFDQKKQILLYGILSGMLGVLVHNFMENIFESQAMVSMFWVMAAIIMTQTKTNNNDIELPNVKKHI